MPVKRLVLDVGGVQHDAHRRTEGLRWEVVAELRPDDTRVACDCAN